jgi:AcrR family transcriptional regulator
MTAPREQTRLATIAQIKAIARQQMADDGTAAISIRGIAREIGVTAPAFYRYYDSRDALITDLILDGFNGLADAVEAARDGAGPGLAPRLLAMAKAYRRWALEHPVDFELIYGNPIPAYSAPSDVTVPAAARPFVAIGEVFAEGYESGAITPPPEYTALPSAVEAHLAAMIARDGYRTEPLVLCMTVCIWDVVHGIVMLELFGHIGPVVGALDAYFERRVLLQLAHMGLHA